MTSNVIPFPNTIVQKVVRDMLRKQKFFDPCAYYIQAVDVLVVVVSNHHFAIEHKSAEGSVYYTCTRPKRVAGFQLSGIRHFLKNEPGWQKVWDVGTLIRTVSLKVGGLRSLFGNGDDDVRDIIRTWKLSVSINPD